MSSPPAPDPAGAGTVDELVERLRLLKVWGGDPSYEIIKERVNATRPPAEHARRSTVANAFQAGRRRLNTDLVLAVVRALRADEGYVNQWRQALRVVAGEIEAVSQVRVNDSLPPDLAGFTGRAGELDRLLEAARGDQAVVISAIEGMAGVGKTRLAVHAAHRLHEREPYDRVLFVNLRGFHPDPAQRPADPSAVLDGFLRLLGVPGNRVPHGVDALSAAYREQLAGRRVLVVLDNAATAEQVRPLLPATPGCLALVTSRRRLDDLSSVIHLPVDVFTREEAVSFLAAAVSGVPTGPDPRAATLIAERCGHLPLALSLIAGHIRHTPGWTLTDHADRLGERRRDRRLDSGVELALTLSYQHLPAGPQRALRLAALHPGQDFDAYAVAALTDVDLPTARAWLDDLRADHLVQETGPDRFTLHDLVRAHAATRAHDQDRPAERHAALTRLFDHCLAVGAAAMDALHAVEDEELRSRIPAPSTPAPDLTDPGAALAWLDTERPSIVAVAAHTAAHGWPAHTTLLARTLARYFGGGHHNDALTVHGHALQATRRSGDTEGQAHALGGIGVAHLRRGRPDEAGVCLRQALEKFRQVGDRAGQSRVLFNLGLLEERGGRYPAAIEHKRQALALDREAGNRVGEATDLVGLAALLEVAGRVDEAADAYQQALTVSREIGDRRGEAYALNGLGEIDGHAGRFDAAADHLAQALALHRTNGNRDAEAGALESLGALHTRLGEVDRAIDLYTRSLAIFHEIGNQDNEAWVHNSLGEAVHLAGRPAATHHASALAIAAANGNRRQQARAHTGLGHSHRAEGDLVLAREHFEQAMTIYTDLGVAEAAEVRVLLEEAAPA